MHSEREATAALDAVGGVGAIDTGLPFEFEWCVRLGGVTAEAWLAIDRDVRMHDF